MNKIYFSKKKPQDECAVFGVFNNNDASTLTTLGLHALQHRGQDSTGIVSYKNNNFFAHRGIGQVGDVFQDPNILNELKGSAAIGHNRYGTTGESALKNVQPLFSEILTGGIAIAHNGNLTNTSKLKEKLISNGSIFQSTSDTEVILHLISTSKGDLHDRIIYALNSIHGAYSLLILSHNSLIGIRDPFGIRPMVLGKLNESYILSSESCGLDIIGAELIRDVEAGEMIVIDNDGIKSYRPFKKSELRPCLFEYIYFSRPDSILLGKSVYNCRKSFGATLAKESYVEADVVTPVPDSGVPAAIGFAEHANIPFEMGIIRNHYVGRTFIEPTQLGRQLGVKRKHNPNKAHVTGKRVVLIDDSIVRGTTSVKIVQMMREAGATEVHMRIACPPITHPDFYGIDTPTQDQLLAATHSMEEMKEYIGADSLAFLSIDGMYRAMGYEEGRNNDLPQFTDHCFTGDYPTALTDREGDEDFRQLSLLQEQG